ncbi:protein kinase/lanthionine synthetase C family protein [Paraflavitalea pollutisoli]|uniref:protein kinase/lanthionine synthetase C family protein n=1 Tax=Paraflavitalea pollutisoli TaxID=3034143 RepID=UPI0023EB4972|nr:protein kinase/lanthionine synthetase C family protein [Paraflavitalea sp. H1-2-19X]
METQTLVASVVEEVQEPASLGKVEKKSGKRIGFNYIIIKSLKESQKNDVVKCLYIKSLTNFGLCVIKEGTQGDSKDEHGRDIQDRLKWQKKLHEQLQGKLRIPRCYGSFEENGNYYLVIERIKGVPLYKLVKGHQRALRAAYREKNALGLKMLRYMRKMALLMAGMHQENIIHRDVTPNNFMIHGNKVGLIDFELSYSLDLDYPAPPFKLGTYGYMSPEQLRTEIPTKAQDVYALGAVFLFMVTGISTNKILCSEEAGLQQRIAFFVPDKELAGLLQRCLKVDAAQRPTIAEVIEVIDRVIEAPATNGEFIAPVIDKDEVRQLVQRFIGTLHSELLCDRNRGWFSEHQKMPVKVDKNTINKAWYASLYNGAAGVIYFLSQAKVNGFEVDGFEDAIEQGIVLIRKKYIDRIERASPSLHTGASGIALALSEGMRSGVLGHDAELVEWINLLLQVPNTRLNYSSGVAGQGIAYLGCRDIVLTDKIHQATSAYVSLLLETQEKDGSWNREGDEKKRRATKGYHNGVAGIVAFLLEYSARYDDRAALPAAEAGLAWLMRKANWKRDKVEWLSSQKKRMAPWVREGTAGIAAAFINAFQRTGNIVFKRFAYGALHSFEAELVDGMLSQADGLSGLGEIYLQAAKVFGDDQWFHRAEWIVQVILNLRRDDEAAGPFWLVEGERKPVADLMVGNTGVALFLMKWVRVNQNT